MVIRIMIPASFDNGNLDTDAVLVGLYYDPVDQLTIGLEGEWIHTAGYNDSNACGP